MDTADIYAPVTKRAWFVAFLSCVLIIAAGLGIYLWWVSKRERYVRSLYEAELELAAGQAKAEEELRRVHGELELRVAERTAELSLERNKLKGILDAMNDGVYIANRRHEIVYMNPVIEREFGAVGNLRCHEYLYGRAEPCPCCADSALFDDMSWCWEWHRGAGGKVYDICSIPLVNADGAIVKLGLLHDVTERKQAEETIRQSNEDLEHKVAERTRRLEDANTELHLINDELTARRCEAEAALDALRKSESRFRQLIDASPVAIAIIEPLTGMIQSIPDAPTCWAIRRRMCRPLDRWWIKAFPDPVYREQVREEWLALIAVAADTSGVARPLEAVVTCRDNGSTRVIEFHTARVGELIMVMLIDLTERLQAQERLLKLSRAVENSPTTVVITDRNGLIEYVNPKFSEVTGFSAEEALGRNPSILNAGVQSKEFYHELWATILGGNEWRGEFCNKKKNNEVYWNWPPFLPFGTIRVSSPILWR